MNDYVIDTVYPSHFHRETAPAWLHAVAIALGHRAADPSRRFTWCELGCGDGFNATLLAAANPQGRFVAVDVNASHIEQARQRADDAGLPNIEFVHADLRAFAADRNGDRDIDYLVCHGLWSWVADDVRDALLDLASRRLAPDGLLYLAYMSHPGASPMLALQQLLYRRAATLSGDSPARATAALDWLRRLADAGLGCIAEHPGLRRQLAAMAEEPPSQIAHEFLTAHWQPQHAGDVIERLARSGFDYIGSATPLENMDALSLPGDAQSMIAAIDDIPLRESAKDAARNQSLRRDLFQRAGTRWLPDQHRLTLDRVRFAVLPGAPVRGALTLSTRIGPVPVPEELSTPILTALAGGAKSFAQLTRSAEPAIRPGMVNRVIQTLLWAGCLHPAPLLPTTEACARLNAQLRDATAGDQATTWQAETALGTAVSQPT